MTEPNLTDIQQAIEAFGRRRYEEGRAHGEAAANRALMTTPHPRPSEDRHEEGGDRGQ